MKVDLFDFDLPIELIAQHPARPRDSARLLHVPPSGENADLCVADLAGLLRPGDIMVFNNTKVIPARLLGHRQRPGSVPRAGGSPPGSGPRIEVTLHKRESASDWLAFARPGKKLAVNDVIHFADDFSATVLGKGDGGEIALRFNQSGTDLGDALVEHGAMPLPPYIHRDDLQEDADPADYQTMYAEHEGAVAAPTAGLHFTPAMFEALDARGIMRAFVTLHVGAGTFLPVKVDDTADHRMHAEWGEVSAETADAINAARAAGGRIVAVGTTALRLLESAATEDRTIKPFCDDTSIFITPGYTFRAIDVLMTNFHLPRSTLFMLICAFAGMDRMIAAYTHAKTEGYRFYSYGDACLLERPDS